MIGYSEATAFDPAVTGKIFNLSCLAPFAGFVALALILVFLYPLSKTRVEQNIATLLHAVRARKTKLFSLPYHLPPLRRTGTPPEHRKCARRGCLFSVKKGCILNLYESPHGKGADP